VGLTGGGESSDEGGRWWHEGAPVTIVRLRSENWANADRRIGESERRG
jgi:hypothetical protein